MYVHCVCTALLVNDYQSPTSGCYFLFACSADTQIVDMSGIHLPAFLSHFNFSSFLRKVETVLLLAIFILVSHYLFMLFYYINVIFYILTLS